MFVALAVLPIIRIVIYKRGEIRMGADSCADLRPIFVALFWQVSMACMLPALLPASPSPTEKLHSSYMLLLLLLLLLLHIPHILRIRHTA